MELPHTNERPLLRCHFGPGAAPWGELVSNAMGAFGAWLLFFTSCPGAVRNQQDVMIMGLLFVALFVFFTLVRTVPALVRARGSVVELDEGGARLKSGALTMYLPFDLLGGGDLHWGLGRRVFRLLDRTGRPLATIPVFGDAGMRAIDLGGAIRRRASEGLRRVELPQSVQRRGMALDAWAEALADEGKKMAGHYRGDGLDPEVARADVVDPRVHPEDRAALAALLLAAGDPRDERLVGELLGPASPPLLVALVERLRPGLVSAELRDEVTPFLADET